MIEDPAILANIILVLFIGLFLVIAWLVLSTIARWIVSGVSRDDEPEPETFGDDGGRPTAAEMHRATKRPTAIEMHQATKRPTAYERQQAIGHPKAPENGSGLQAGDMDPGGWPAYGLKRLDGHKRGRVEVTGKAGK